MKTARVRPGDVVAHRFEIQRLAGEGGMGAVYLARDRERAELVALKLMTRQVEFGVQRFMREAEVLRALDHPAIVRYVAHGAEEGHPFLVMEWLEGEDLATRLARGALAPAESIELVRQAALALGTAHARGIVHRDIKPSNLFLSEGRPHGVKVVDFGIARLAEVAGVATQTGTVIGTPGYMAPEQARGSRDIDARADVFSLGCVLFECLAGRPAFMGETYMAILAKILLEDTPRLSQIVQPTPPELDAIVSRMMAKERDARPRDGRVLADELGRIDLTAQMALARTELQPHTITHGEQRLLSVVVARGAEAPPDALAPTVPERPAETALEQALRSFDARLERLLDGSVVVTLQGGGAATDQAARAARCALSLHRLLDGASVALATGRGEVAGRFPVGEVIDRASELARGERGAGVRIDQVTAGLLDARFEVQRATEASWLTRERAGLEAPRRLLGRPVPWVGRRRELASLVGLYEECAAESESRAVLVTAPPGVGKSRLREEFLRKVSLDEHPPEVWIGRGDSMSAQAPFVMIAPILRRAAGVRDGEPLDQRRQKIAARVARHVGEADRQRVTAFVAELAGAPFPDDDDVKLSAARRDAVLMGDQMRRAWEDFVLAEASAAPLLVVLEDLHWGDLPSVSFIDAALRVAKSAPLMVLALARPEVLDVFPKLWSGRGLQSVELGSLSKRSAEKLLRHMLGEATPETRVQRLVERGAGNAFYLEELIRAELEGKGDAAPETVLAMLQARFDALEPETRRVLRAASVLGQAFWRGGLARLLGNPGNSGDLRNRLMQLVDRELVTETSSARFEHEAEYRFCHALIRDAAYASLTDSDRALAHALAAEWLESVGETDALVVAEHFQRGNQLPSASVWFTRAAKDALDGNDFSEAIARAERAVSSGAEGETLGTSRLVQMRAHGWRGEWADGAACGDEAVGILPEGSDAWAVAVSETAMAHAALDHPERVVALARELGARATSGDGCSGEVLIARARAVEALAQCGRAELGQAILPALATAQAKENPLVAARIQRVHATMALLSGDLGSFVELCASAAADSNRAGDRRAACSATMNIGFGLIELGVYEEATNILSSMLETAEQLGLQAVAAYARQNLGLALARLGNLDGALAMETRALDALLAQGDRRGESATRTYLAEILFLAGDVESAEREASEGAVAAGQHPAFRSHALAMRAFILLRKTERAPNAIETLLEITREAMAPLESGGLDDAEALVRLTRGEALALAGHQDESARVLRVARDRVHARAAKISNPRWRASFLERVLVHARTLELAARHRTDEE